MTRKNHCLIGFILFIVAGTNILQASPVGEATLFEKLIGVLVSSALVFSLIKGYLTVNKIWKRRKNEEVANSISIVAAMLGFAVGFPFLLNSVLITNDYFSAAKSVIALCLAFVFTMIGTGYYVDNNRGVGFITLLGRALNLERKESGELLSDMLRPKGARKIIDILVKLAAIDDDIAQEEIDLINQFAEKWNIDIPELVPGKPETVTNLVELKSLVQSYLDEGPDLVLYFKYLLTILGENEYKYHFNPTDALSRSQKTFAREQLNIFLRWWDAWSGSPYERKA